MKRVWTARSLAAVLGGSLLYFLITVLVMMCGSFSPLFWVFLPAITAAASGWLYLYLAARTPRFGVPVLMNLVVLLLFLAAGERSWCGGWAGMRACGPPAGAFSRWPSAPAGVPSTFGSTRPGRQPAPQKRCPQPMPRRWRGLPRRGCWP